MKGILLEGICGAGKTSVFRKLMQLTCKTAPDAFISISQQYSQRMFEHIRPQISIHEVLKMYEPLLTHLKSLDSQFKGSVFVKHPRRSNIEPKFLVESTHLNCIIEFSISKNPAIDKVTCEFSQLGGTVVFLTVPEDQILERCITSTRLLRSIGWAEYLKELSDNDNDLVEIMLARQATLRSYLEENKIRYVTINTGTKSWNHIARSCMKLMEL
ncbi:hypothetical protein HCU66_26310 [Pseudomonas frederiksbergensis]|uniref:hypothetical protein n=1 Tax=Pseudomonas frederiksbergensis TaxID=104087 RepID=UPI00197CD9A0|nr:hypothetical protein [Pseudomonas frederiksbergensis]MBN3865708.1 hypothetical protein [Pseudomonas frederiksbergensis]